MPHKIRNWDEFQHYKTGRAAPPWIKLYRDLLNDVEWFELPAEAAKFLISCWLIAAEGNGVLPDNKALAFRLRISLKETEKFLRLCKHWIICDDSNVLAKGYQDASPEEEREEEVEEEREKIIHQPKQVRSKDSKSKDFDKFWLGYPRKVGKGAAEKAWVKAVQSTEAQTIIASLGSHKFSEDINYIPHPATWLNQRRWEDVPAVAATNTMSIHEPEAMFPESGSIEYTTWANRIRAHNTGHDPDWIANRFRDFCRSKNIEFNSPHIVKALDGFTRAQKRV